DVGFPAVAEHLYWNPHEKTLLSSGLEGTVLWDPATLTRRATLPIANAAPAWSPDGKILATGGPGNAVTLWDGLTGRHRGVFPSRAAAVTRLSWSPAGRLLAVGTGSSPSTPAFLAAASARLVLWDVQ